MVIFKRLDIVVLSPLASCGCDKKLHKLPRNAIQWFQNGCSSSSSIFKEAFAEYIALSTCELIKLTISAVNPSGAKGERPLPESSVKSIQLLCDEAGFSFERLLAGLTGVEEF